jgi:hypothetical protein
MGLMLRFHFAPSPGHTIKAEQTFAARVREPVTHTSAAGMELIISSLCGFPGHENASPNSSLPGSPTGSPKNKPMPRPVPGPQQSSSQGERKPPHANYCKPSA